MAIKWSLDTCECVILYEIIDEKMIIHEVINKCEHGKADDLESCLNCISKNKHKNMCITQLIEEYNVKPETVDWSYDNNGELVLSHTDIDKSNIDSAISSIKIDDIISSNEDKIEMEKK